MGLTYVTLRLRKHEESEDSVEAQFLVDSGAAYTVAPADILRQLGIKPRETRSFILANGEKISRQVGNAYLELGENAGYSKVIFGEEGDSNLLGVVTLEGLGLIFDPIKRELKPLPMLLMQE